MDEKSSISSNLKEFFDKLKSDKKAFAAVIIGIVGMILIMFSELLPDESESTQEHTVTEASNSYDTERELEKFIESIQGAGESKVMITYESTQETVYAENEQESNNENKSEYKNEYIIVDSDSGETGLARYSVYPKIRGVAVVCQGGDNAVVKQRIVSAVSALFSISSNKISVTAMTQ